MILISIVFNKVFLIFCFFIVSGGNKRKLSIVIFFIGDLLFIFFDEFIIGMDFGVWC